MAVILLILCAIAFAAAPINCELRVLNGESDTAPYMVSLQFSNSSDKCFEDEETTWHFFSATEHHPFAIVENHHHICSGAIISDQHIISAGHCIKFPEFPEKYSVVIGTNNLKEVSKFQRYCVKYIKRHERFSENNYRNDIAVLQLNRKMIFGSTIQPIKFSVKFATPGPGIRLKMAGWGQTRPAEGTSDELRALTFQPWDCPEYLKENHLNTIICAKTNTNESGTCRGDSGSPLIFLGDSNTNPEVLGILSRGGDCQIGQITAIFTRLSPYYQWIMDRINSAEPNTKP